MPKLPTQPLCRACGKPIRKSTQTHYVDDGPARPSEQKRLTQAITHYPGKELFTKAECQSLTNHQIVSVRKAGYSYFGTRDPERIRSFSTWDGESYVDGLFCSGTCAEAFGRMAAANHPEIMTVAYADAVKERAA